MTSPSLSVRTSSIRRTSAGTGEAIDTVRRLHGHPQFNQYQERMAQNQSSSSLFGGRTGPFPAKTFALTEGLVHDLFAENRPQVLLHGDFHHFNILSSGGGWLVIDPKGVIGPAEYELGPLLMNPNNQLLEETEAIHRTQRRIATLSERLGFDPQRLRAWAICHSVLSAFWDMAEDGSGCESSRAWTEIFIKTKV